MVYTRHGRRRLGRGPGKNGLMLLFPVLLACGPKPASPTFTGASGPPPTDEAHSRALFEQARRVPRVLVLLSAG
ncbi:MAG: hypothetical protein KC656_16935 [Myxococcales bacterium]|nr:hypothetical protein [Myxococcales bacterium]MCB9694375.1 hypothetical protein [Alphaproteobacteria bacterium]